MNRIRAWSFLIAGVAALGVGTLTVATIDGARAEAARVNAASLASACTTEYGTTTDEHGRSISVATLTCPRPTTQIASKAPF